MAKNSMYGWAAPSKYTADPNAFNDGELVKCIIIAEQMPSSYMKEISEKNAERRKEAELSGLPFDVLKPSYRTGGIALRICILERSKTAGNWERTHGIDDEGKLKEPSYNIYTTFEQLAPPYALEKRRDQRKGGSYELNNKIGMPKIVDYLPNVYPERGNEKDVAFADQMQADKIPAGMEERYKDLIQKEKARVKAWQQVLNFWATLSENECKSLLLDNIAKRLLLGRIEGKQFVYEVPAVGTMFTAKIKKADDSPYFNLIAYEWNGSAKRYDYYCNAQTTPVTEVQVSAAKDLEKLRLDSIELRKQLAEAKKLQEDIEDQPGF